MKSKVWILQAIFNASVIGGLVYMYSGMKKVSGTSKYIRQDLLDLGEDLDILDDRLSDVQAELEAKIYDVEHGIDRTVSAEDILKDATQHEEGTVERKN